jgi:hypothetical protein
MARGGVAGRFENIHPSSGWKGVRCGMALNDAPFLVESCSGAPAGVTPLIFVSTYISGASSDGVPSVLTRHYLWPV